MSEYTDITLLNCNRSASVEARTDNDTNPAVFTNPLQQTLQLNVGDKVSVERAFISEIGAGNPSTIEFKGSSRGSNLVAPYTDILKSDYFYKKSNAFDPNYRLGYYRKIITTLKEDGTADLRDNLAPMVLGYYITSNEYPNYIQHPRQFAQNNFTQTQQTTGTSNHFTTSDSATYGFCAHTINPNIYVDKDWVGRQDAASNKIYKQRVDNTRFTLFIKDTIIYSKDLVDSEILVRQMFPTDSVNGIFSEKNYVRVRERVDLEVDEGFNTPTAVASKLTQQLTETKRPENFQIFDGAGFNRTITKLIESTTYKPINAQNLYAFNSETHADYIASITNIGNLSQKKLDYISSFGYIAIKRPEIYEVGKKMMKDLVVEAFAIYEIAEKLTEWFEGKYWKGLQVIQPLVNLDPPLRFVADYDGYPNSIGQPGFGEDVAINVEWTEPNLRLLRDWFDTQNLYPELFESLKNSKDYGLDEVKLAGDTYGNADQFDVPANAEYPTQKNSRFFHINTMASEGVVPRQEQLGQDNFKNDTGSENVNKASGLVMFQYDEETRDYFVEAEQFDFTKTKLCYGFARPFEIRYQVNLADPIVIKYYVQVITATRGGLPPSLFTNKSEPVEAPTQIEHGRRIGFDLHSTAYGTSIITPFSGYSNCDIGTDVQITKNDGTRGIEELSSTNAILTNVNSKTNGVNLTPYKTMTYVGANNPAFDYNTTSNRFEIRRFHTSNNTGNRLMAGTQLTAINSDTQVPTELTGFGLGNGQNKLIPPPKNISAGDVVYKINPRPPQLGYSPTFKPYRRFNQAYRVGVYPEGPNEVNGDATKTALNRNNFETPNENIEPYEIFDSHGGIYIDDWGFDRDNWKDSLWDILGFDYNAVNSEPTDKNVLTRRIDNDNNNILYRPTTNAEIVSTDSKVYISNLFNANMYYTSVPFPDNIIQYTTYLSHTSTAKPPVLEYGFAPQGTNGTPLTFYPEISIKTESTTIVATNIQKSVLRPYYTIRSSLIEGFTSIGGNPTGANLPIIDILDKYSAGSDYFFGNPSGLIFTITKPTIISDITTSVHDPDGEYSNIDNTSAIIYKVQKLKKTPTNIIQDILDGAKKPTKK